jgi:hypothetical protein
MRKAETSKGVRTRIDIPFSPFSGGAGLPTEMERKASSGTNPNRNLSTSFKQKNLSTDIKNTVSILKQPFSAFTESAKLS